MISLVLSILAVFVAASEEYTCQEALQQFGLSDMACPSEVCYMELDYVTYDFVPYVSCLLDTYEPIQEESVVLLGDSHIDFFRGWSDGVSSNEFIPGSYNLGVAGAACAALAYWAPTVLERTNPKTVVLSCGANDMFYYGASAQQAYENLKVIFDMLEAHESVEKVVYFGLFNSIVGQDWFDTVRDEFNSIVEESLGATSYKTEFRFVNLTPISNDVTGNSKIMSSDGMHFNAYGYSSLFGPTIMAVLDESVAFPAYWDEGACGPYGDDYNRELCGEGDRFNCPEEVKAESCPSGKALKIRQVGNNSTNIILDGCEYSYYTQYQCQAAPTSRPTTEPSTPPSPAPTTGCVGSTYTLVGEGHCRGSSGDNDFVSRVVNGLMWALTEKGCEQACNANDQCRGFHTQGMDGCILYSQHPVLVKSRHTSGLCYSKTC